MVMPSRRSASDCWPCAPTWDCQSVSLGRQVSVSPPEVVGLPYPLLPESLVRRQRHSPARDCLAAVVINCVRNPLGVLCEYVIRAFDHAVVDADTLLGVQLVHELVHRTLGHELVGVAVQH